MAVPVKIKCYYPHGMLIFCYCRRTAIHRQAQLPVIAECTGTENAGPGGAGGNAGSTRTQAMPRHCRPSYQPLAEHLSNRL